ncbi:hypothetical protein ODZ83_02145 [Acaricomes phytoseiuli]|uniref:hypothetical protein n=1 Tax=Acaricomes phytoseiuli TaxID=291968 RepID=UPI00036FACE6|nr:hypothetical protein [Acaricomes phytoseiuli]MCW1249004.1 hypothetical protein [Acaricomes phytoseiuli]
MSNLRIQTADFTSAGGAFQSARTQVLMTPAVIEGDQGGQAMNNAATNLSIAWRDFMERYATSLDSLINATGQALDSFEAADKALADRLSGGSS